jgi:formylmethanofuran dehydrogenase subunit C
MIELKLKKEPGMMVGADSISPDRLSGKTREEILGLPLYRGNKAETIGDYFDLTMAGMEDKIRLVGDLSKFNRIAEGMTKGAIEIDRNVGNHLGAWMKSGEISVRGSVGDYCGAMMEGGIIKIDGNARNYLGANYIGHKKGMAGGEIVVKGSAGLDVGAYMAGGKITVQGDSADFTGFALMEGEICVKSAGYGVGSNMTGGKIVCGTAKVLPTFVMVKENEFQGDLCCGGKGVLILEGIKK